jgi:hypothetical protein
MNYDPPIPPARVEHNSVSYQNPWSGPLETSSDTIFAALMALPGVCGFALLIGALGLQSRIAWKIGPNIGLGLWLFAFICASYSFIYFRGKRKNNWVKLCLGLNWFGVAFTLTPPGWMICLMAIAASHS